MYSKNAQPYQLMLHKYTIISSMAGHHLRWAWVASESLIASYVLLHIKVKQEIEVRER